jgi:hypothetical protein
MDIACKSETKFLGIHVSEYMKWDAHVMSLSSKLSKLGYMIKSLKDVTSPHVKRSIYFAYIHAYLRYGLVFWGGDSKSKIVFKLQKWVIRIISGMSRYTSCRQLFKGPNILPVPCMYISEAVCHIKLHIEKLEQNTAIYNHNTRQKLNFHVQFCRKNALKKGVMNMGIKLYNNLPNKFKEVEKIRQYKRDLRSSLLRHTFYSVDEYICHAKLAEHDI